MPGMYLHARCVHCKQYAWLLDSSVTDVPQWICGACAEDRYAESLAGTNTLEADSIKPEERRGGVDTTVPRLTKNG